MESVARVLQTVVLANTVGSWLLAALVIAATFLVVPFARGRIRAHMAARGRLRQGESPMLDLLVLLASRTSRLVLLSVALYLAEKLLHLPVQVDRLFDVVIVFGVAVQCAIWGVVAFGFFIDHHYTRSRQDAASRAPVTVMLFIGQLVIWAVFLLLALDNLGVNITALVAGLGIGGIAIALAVQTLLGDLLASMSIAMDKPFVVGDSLRIDDIEGAVEYIGIKSTRLRANTGEQVIIANADVLKSRVRNLGRMPERRTAFRLRFPYDSTPAEVARIPVLVEEAVRAVEGTRFVSCLLAAIGDYALEFEVLYFISNTDGRIPRVNDAVNRGILQRLAAERIALAYPTQRQIGAPGEPPVSS